MSIFPKNDAMFDEVRALKLPLGRYAITSSGPLGIRDVREIGDVDLIVDQELWDILATRFPVVVADDVTRIKVSENIEVLGDGSNFTGVHGGPSTYEQISSAEIIGELPFVTMENVLYFKEQMNREKDQRDIVVLKRLLGREAQ